MLLALNDKTIPWPDPITINGMEIYFRGIDAFINTEQGISLVHHLDVLDAFFGKPAVHGNPHAIAVIDIDPARAAIAVRQQMKPPLERGFTFPASAIEIDTKADAAHDQAVAHQQHLLTGGNPELQVATLTNLRHDALAGGRSDFDLRKGHSVQLGLGQLQRVGSHSGRFESIERGFHQRVTPTQYESHRPVGAAAQNIHR